MPRPQHSRDTGGCRAVTGIRDWLWLQWQGFPGFAAEDPWTFPKGHLQRPQHWPSTSLSEDISGVPGSELGYPHLPVLKVLSVQILSLLDAWPKPITTFHCQFSLRKGFSFCPFGVPEFEVMPTYRILRSSNKVRQSTGKLKQSRFNILAGFCYLSNNKTF